MIKYTPKTYRYFTLNETNNIRNLHEMSQCHNFLCVTLNKPTPKVVKVQQCRYLQTFIYQTQSLTGQFINTLITGVDNLNITL